MPKIKAISQPEAEFYKPSSARALSFVIRMYQSCCKGKLPMTKIGAILVCLRKRVEQMFNIMVGVVALTLAVIIVAFYETSEKKRKNKDARD